MDDDIMYDRSTWEMFPDYPSHSDMEQFELDCLAHEMYWDCLDFGEPPEFLEDTPQ